MSLRHSPDTNIEPQHSRCRGLMCKCNGGKGNKKRQINISNEASKLNAISWIRQEFESDINKLKNSNIISTDDAFNFKDIYSLFDPFYVTYDDAFDKYPSLTQTANTIINNNSHLEYHKKHVE